MGVGSPTSKNPETTRAVFVGTMGDTLTSHSTWGLVWFERLWQDLRYACRMLANSPGFTLVAVLSLAIGIGANCAAFSWADALILRPLPVARPSEVLTVGSTTAIEGFSRLVSSYRDYVDIRDRSTVFSGLTASTGQTAGFAATRDDTPRVRLGMLVSGNFFTVLGVEPQLGRNFRPDEDQVPGRDAVVILGHDFWQTQFAADPSVLGRTVRLSGIEFTVIGVAPAEFKGLNQFVAFEFYAPLMMWPRFASNPTASPLEARDVRALTLKGRLKPGVTMAQAQTELSIIARDLERAYPDTNKNRNLLVQTELQSRLKQDYASATLVAMLSTLAAAVLFVACANVAGLLTSRAPARAKEIAMRLAIGAGRSRLVRQLITESLVIAILGGALGLAVGYAAIGAFKQIQLPTDLPVALAFEMNQRALVFSFAVAVVSGLLFGLVPAIRSTRADLTAVMKAGDSAGIGPRRRWGRALLVGGQVAVSVVLLGLATFMYRGFQRQLGTGPGYRTDHLLMMSFDPGLIHYSEADTHRFYKEVLDRARTVPGVKSVTVTSSVPMSTDGGSAVTLVPEGFTLPDGKETVTLLAATVDEYYFDTMRIAIVKGRGFREADDAGAPKVAVVNEQFAQHYWPGRDPLGKRFRLDKKDGPWVEIVGVVKTSKYIFIAEPPTDFVYLPHRQRPQQELVMLAESIGDPAALTAPLRDVVRRIDANQPIFNVRTMEEFYRLRAISITNMIIDLIGAMGVMGLALSIVGLYGLVAYGVSRRTREIGIRMAIGADRTSVLRMILRHGMLLAAAGLGAGLLGSVGAGRILAALFPGGGDRSRGFDYMALVLVASAVLLATFVASYVPARRASRVEPTEALRYE